MIVWRLSLTKARAALAQRLELQAAARRWGNVNTVLYWQRDIDQLEGRIAELEAYRDAKAARRGAVECEKGR